MRIMPFVVPNSLVILKKYKKERFNSAKKSEGNLPGIGDPNGSGMGKEQLGGPNQFFS